MIKSNNWFCFQNYVWSSNKLLRNSNVKPNTAEEKRRESITWNTDVVSKHKAAGGGHYARNNDDRSDLCLEIAAAAGTSKTSTSHGCSRSTKLNKSMNLPTMCSEKKKKKRKKRRKQMKLRNEKKGEWRGRIYKQARGKPNWMMQVGATA